MSGGTRYEWVCKVQVGAHVRMGAQGTSGCTRYECGQLKKRPVFAAAAGGVVHFFARVLYGRLK